MMVYRSPQMSDTWAWLVASLKNLLVIGDHHPMFMVAHQDYWKPPDILLLASASDSRKHSR